MDGSEELFSLSFHSLLVSRAFEVGLIEEDGEEQQVAEVHDKGVDDVVHGGDAVDFVFPEIEEPQNAQPHEHLRDLHECDQHGDGSRHASAGRSNRVVAVHECMDGVVHGHEPAAAGHTVFIRVPAVQQDSDVMIPVQEDQTLLTQDDEHRVPEFRRFTQSEGKRPELADGGAVELRVTHRLPEPM